MKNKIEFIAFDADDTLWENELYFQELEHKFCHLLRKYSPAPSVSEEMFKTEIKNLHIYGYVELAFNQCEVSASMSEALGLTDVGWMIVPL